MIVCVYPLFGLPPSSVLVVLAVAFVLGALAAFAVRGRK